MNKMTFITLMICVGISACGPSLETQNQDALSKWKGQPVDRLIYEWGSPDSSFRMNNGRTVLTFEHETITEDYGYSEDGDHYVESVDQIFCRIDWITDEDRTRLIESKSSGDPEACTEMIVPLP